MTVSEERKLLEYLQRIARALEGIEKASQVQTTASNGK